MESKKRNGVLLTAILTVALLGAIYLIISRFSKKEDAGTKLVYNDHPVAESPKTENSVDSLEDEDFDGDIPAMSDLPTSTQIAIKRIDHYLDKAFNLQPGPQRTALLAASEKSLDSLMSQDDNPFYHVSTGDLKMLQGKYQESEKHYAIALKRVPYVDGLAGNHASACYNASVQSIRRNDTDAAIRYLETFRMHIQDDQEANQLLVSWYVKRGVGLMRTGKNKQGHLLLKKALVLAPEDHAVLFNLGIANYRFKEYDKAIKQFKECLRLKPEDVNSKSYLYTIYTRLGDKQMAEKYKSDPLN